MSIVPKTAIPAAASAPTVDGAEGAGRVHRAEALDVGRKWEPGGNTRNCDPQGVDCGSLGALGHATAARTPRSPAPVTTCTSSSTSGTTSRATRSRRTECVGHWQADSVEILIDPRGNSHARRNRDTATTFKLGVFPFTNDPAEQQRQRRQRPVLVARRRQPPGLLDRAAGRARSSDAPNAPGVQVATDARWVGSNDTSADHAYAGGGYTIEVKIPMAELPAAVDPDRMGLNITPYDNDDNTAEGGLDDAAAHRHEHAPGVVDVRQRAVRPVPLGPRDAAGLHPAGGPLDRRPPTRTCRARTSTARSRRRRSPSPRATACRSPVGCPPPRATGSPPRRPRSRPPRSSST